MFEPTKSTRPAIPDFFRDYKTRQWKTYELPAVEWKAEAPPLRTVDIDSEIIACDSDSEMAKNLEAHPRRFYFDLEMIEAGIDPIRGCDLRSLTASWRGHRTGSLALHVIYVPTMEELEATNFTAPLTHSLAVEI